MLAQCNVLFVTSAILLPHLFLTTQGLALPTSTHEHVSRHVNTTMSAAMQTEPTTGNLAQRDIPPPIMGLLKSVEKLVKRDAELAERDIPAPVMGLLKSIDKLVKRDAELAERDIPAPVTNLLIKRAEKLV